MREIIDDIATWEEPVAVATVVKTWGSAPRQAGAKLAMTPGHKLAGSVSGGCIEGAVFEEGMAALETGASRLLSYGVADETAFETVGLACGGTIEVFVEPLTAQLREFWLRAIARDLPAVTATVVAGPAELIGYKLLLDADGGAQFNRDGEGYNIVTPALLTAAELALRQGRGGVVDLHIAGPGARAFVDVTLPAPHLIIVGAVHIAIALTQLAKAMGFHVTVIDPRPAFGNAARFPHADRLIAAYPQQAFDQLLVTRSTAIVTLTHDDKFDDPALAVALNSPAFYIGALGSRQTHARRRERLLKRGLGAAQLDRINAPIGLNLGATSPEEIALAALAQIVAARNGKTAV